MSRRHVFYICGFDPNSPGRYHRLFSEGARQQAAMSGAAIEVGARQRVDAETVAWAVRYEQHGHVTDTRYVLPRWDAIVREHWLRGFWPQLFDLLGTSWLYLRTGALWTMLGQTWLGFITVFAPFFLVMTLLPGAAALLWAVGALAHAGLKGHPLGIPAALAAGGLVAAGWWAYWARRHWYTRWILRGYGFVARVCTVGVTALDERLDGMAAALVRQAQAREDDEILVIGHSLGTALAVSVMARAIRQDPALMRHGPAIGLLTLGHCTPMLSNLPSARRFRDELRTLAEAADLCWVDFSDPIDAYSFGGVDPVAAAGLRAARPGHPQVRSPHFLSLYRPGPQQRQRMNQHELHQQYLCASRPGDAYDFFAMAAGPSRLAQRFGVLAAAA
ncbi:hypothetical protein GT347_06285 [Xylophilus rhododendri]|uniref:Uncharacterized protein n=1 Tax=Xylophilus rhododendri TaxID=2697032 RepID=A0A857J177_9BURK|nr:hypothetical protein [Xylophilus rhododendri]QHI97630.1 hypothetical protein GT347_06285 [Xylophilus rhododendri]